MNPYSLFQVKEVRLKLGTSVRHERFASGTRCLSSQHRTGVISHLTLMEMLRRRCEHLWTGLECNDDDSHYSD
uniref:Uncharacterized protein n=1 Tax=Arion vulgaris TaxID=1028688 RepID=A0A0B7AUX5_9EUPU